DEEPLTAHWPGALSLVLDARFPENPVHAQAFRAVCGGGHTVSVRVSSNAWAAKLAHAIGYPIIATSANQSGSPACYTLADVLAQLVHARKPDLLLDAGELPEAPTSTVVRVKDGRVVILREGAVKIKEERKTEN
ncbi:MAG: Sua5/YciO/YrdC/YwlC family protein, partial [Candidatus Kerfeldbacteria bacterium]|nr:Sua5/YciO/YrdC/YwlC family protein [Candidatus Kerfeldbacteria bacterium]